MSWESVRIGDVCEVTSSKRIFYDEYVPFGVPFWRSKEVILQEAGQTVDDPLFISEERYAELERFGYPEEGDLLVTSVGTIGSIYRVKGSDRFYFKDGNLTWLRKFDSKRVDSRFLMYLLRSAVGQGLINSTLIGSSQKALTISALKGITITLPEVEAQRRIASILMAYDNLIESNRRQITLLEEAAQRLYKEWFVNLRFPGHEGTDIVDGVPAGWKSGKLGEVFEVRNGKDHKALPDGVVPVYGSGGLMRQCNSSLYEGESVLIPRKGTLNNVMYVNEAFWTVDTLFYTHVMLEYGAKYLYQVVKSYDLASLNIGAAVPSMTKAILNELDALIPPKAILELHEEIVGPIYKERDALRRQTVASLEARDRLLPKLMSGEIEV